MQLTLVNQITGENVLLPSWKITDFLFEQLDQYGDQKKDIAKAIDYALNKSTNGNGLVFIGHFDDEIAGAVVINETGMSGYIPENILVYIAVHNKHRGKGYGKQIMEQAIKLCKGDIALHVEKDNPARFLYEKIGFTNPYLEMRLQR